MVEGSKIEEVGMSSDYSCVSYVLVLQLFLRGRHMGILIKWMGYNSTLLHGEVVDISLKISKIFLLCFNLEVTG